MKEIALVDHRRALGVVIALMIALAASNAISGSGGGGYARGRDAGGSAILQDLQHFREMGSVLYVAAHPDDENTQLITYLARGRDYRTAYLSLTRGDGGQNVLGPEFGEKLGVIRTQELLAARRFDGGRQFFTRAIDFGFSKTPERRLRIWDREQVLADVVRVIRTFRPDVIITRFSPDGGRHAWPSHGVGHPGARGVQARRRSQGVSRAARASLTAWQPKRILHQRPAARRVRSMLDIGGNDPVTGESFGKHCRAQPRHAQDQGFGNFAGGAGRGGDRRPESFTLLGGDPATKDIMDGVDTTWARVPGGAEIGTLSRRGDAQPSIRQIPSASVPALLATCAPALAALPERSARRRRSARSSIGSFQPVSA